MSRSTSNSPISPITTHAKSVNWQILVVDDSLTVLNVIAAILRRESLFAVTLELSHFRALEMVQQQPGTFDLNITDYRMPGMTGVALAKHLKAIRQEVPILSVTTTPYETRHNPDFVATIAKPFSPAELLHEVIYQCQVATTPSLLHAHAPPKANSAQKQSIADGTPQLAPIT